MGDRSAIEWTDATWNPIRARNLETGKVGWFCVHASEGCRNCYAEALNRLRGTRVDFKAQNRDRVELFVDPKMLAQPLHWRRARKIFVGSMTDIGGEFVTDNMLDQIWAAMAITPWHTYQLLTKRPDRIRDYVNAIPERLSRIMDVEIDHPTGRARLYDLVDVGVFESFLANLWLGTSAEDQPTLDARVVPLLDTPAAVRFLSLAPLLAPIDLKPRDDPGQCIRCDLGPDAPHDHRDVYRSRGIDLVIVEGESGRHARPMHPDWVRDIRDQCQQAGVAFFFKQWGEWAPSAANTGRGDGLMARVGKKTASRRLDGVIYDALPTIAEVA